LRRPRWETASGYASAVSRRYRKRTNLFVANKPNPQGWQKKKAMYSLTVENAFRMINVPYMCLIFNTLALNTADRKLRTNQLITNFNV
jgi:hypothetical protein